MQIYRNLGGNSNVAGFQIGHEYIVVQFKDRSSYLYTYSSTGVHEIERMKILAHQGRGLNSYISRIIRKRYARKLA